MQTLDFELRKLSRAIDADLISPECFSDVGEAVRGIPSALTSYFGFECPLGSARPVADFALRVASPNERRILAGIADGQSLPDRLLEQPIWKQLRRFGEAWADQADPLAN